MAGAYGRSKARPPGTRNPKALPRLLSLFLLAAVAGAFIRATLADPAGHSGLGGKPSVDIALDGKAGHGAASDSAAHARADSHAGSGGADTAKAQLGAAAAPEFRLPAVAPGRPLAPAPDPSLVKKRPHGPLPIIGANGREPWRVYGASFDASDKRPRVALVVTGLGFDRAATEAGITGLPAAVTLAFSAHAANLDKWVERARAAGHAVLLGVAMEPVDFLRSDPGPRALLTALSWEENLDRLHGALARAAGYVGVVGVMGSRFLASPLPVTLRRIAQWTRGADKQGVALAPITALAGMAGGEEGSGRAR